MWNLRILLTAPSEITAEMRSKLIQRYMKKNTREHSTSWLGGHLGALENVNYYFYGQNNADISTLLASVPTGENQGDMGMIMKGSLEFPSDTVKNPFSNEEQSPPPPPPKKKQRFREKNSCHKARTSRQNYCTVAYINLS